MVTLVCADSYANTAHILHLILNDLNYLIVVITAVAEYAMSSNRSNCVCVSSRVVSKCDTWYDLWAQLEVYQIMVKLVDMTVISCTQSLCNVSVIDILCASLRVFLRIRQFIFLHVMSVHCIWTLMSKHYIWHIVRSDNCGPYELT